MDYIKLIFLFGLVKGIQSWCPAGWYHSKQTDLCVKFNEVKKTWPEARQVCLSEGGDLVSFENLRQRNWFRKEVNSRGAQEAWWLGLHYNTTWTWSDGRNKSQISNIRWNRRVYPKPAPPASCGAYINSTNTAKIENYQCSEKHKFICYRNTSEPVLCPENWRHFRNKCYRVFPQRRKWNVAEAYCVKLGGHLAEVTDSQTNEMIVKTGLPGNDVWIGYKSGNDSIFHWTTGSNSTFTNYVSAGVGKERCVRVIMTGINKGKWSTSSCQTDTYYALCQRNEGWCPLGWKIHQDKCYQLHGHRELSWMDAKVYCQRQGSKFLTIKSEGEQAFVNLQLNALNTAGINILWLGMRGSGKNYEWTDGSRVPIKKADEGYKNWARNQPLTRDEREMCGTIYTGNSKGFWSSTPNCLQRRGFICQGQVGSDFVPVTTARAVTYSCPTGWTLLGSSCYKITSEEQTWHSSRLTCQRLQAGADLIVIETVEEEDRIIDLPFRRQTWIGLNSVAHNDRMVWLDSTPNTTYRNWLTTYPYTDGNLNCVVTTAQSGQRGRWLNIGCSQTRTGLCEMPAVVTQGTNTALPSTPGSSEAREKCGLLWEDDVTSPYCYQFNLQSATWRDARVACKAHGGELLSISSLHEQKFIAGRLSQVEILQMWIGMNSLYQPLIWGWSDTSPAPYFNWKEAFPKRFPRHWSCGQIMLSDYQWVNADCGDRQGYICKKRGNVLPSTTAPTVAPTVPTGYHIGCQPGWSTYNGRCYRFFMWNNVSWDASEQHCVKLGANLVSLENRREQDFVLSLLQEMRPNQAVQRSVGHFIQSVWIGLEERRNREEYEWSDGSKITYTNWGMMNPYQSSGKNCGFMFLRDGTWGSYGCDNGFVVGFVCEKSTGVFPGAPRNTSRDQECPTGWLYSYKENCYKIGQNKVTWTDAVANCKRDGGNLASVINRYEQSYLSSHLAVSSGYYWVGLRTWRNNTDGGTGFIQRSAWNDSSTVRYTNWYQGFTGGESDMCVAMSTGTEAGLWIPYNCSQTYGYVCKTKKIGYSTSMSVSTTPTPTQCRRGWTKIGQDCYKAFVANSSQALSWEDAAMHCLRNRPIAFLASIHSNAENTAVANLVFKRNPKPYFWIGLNHRDDARGEHWTDGSAVNFHSWNRQPDRNRGLYNCVEFNSRTGKWSYSNCDVPKSWICKTFRGFPHRRNFSRPLFTHRPQLAFSPECGNGWLRGQDSCYFVANISSDSDLKTWYQAREICRNMSGELVSIHSNHERRNLVQAVLRRHNVGKFLWIGLNELNTLGQYRWSDGSTSDFFSWDRGEPNDHNYGERCVHMETTNGFWEDENCEARKGYICKKTTSSFVRKTVPPTETVRGYCPEGFFGIGNKCFGIFATKKNEKVNFTDAIAACQNKTVGLRPNIASISNAQENAIIVAHLPHATNYGYWIGFNTGLQRFGIFGRGSWHWVDNSPAGYTNWAEGEPNSLITERCAELWVRNDIVGLWNNIPCNRYRGYICQVYKDPSATIPTSAPQDSRCKEGFIKYGDACYKRYEDKMKWQDAKEACSKDGAELVSITGSISNSAVFYLMTKVGDPVWIGLNGLEVKGTFVWSDGWPVTFTRWGADQPGKEKCVSMAKQGTWNTVKCDKKLRFVCKVALENAQSTTRSGPELCPKAWIHEEHQCYQFHTTAKKWPDAEFDCVRQGAHLTSVWNMEENKWIYQKLQEKTYNGVWLGMLKGGKVEGWVWSDHSATVYTNFSQGQPSGTGGWTACVTMSPKTGGWNDINCDVSQQYVCKMPAITTTTTLKKKSVTTTPFIAVLQGKEVAGGGGLSTGWIVGIVFIIIVAILVVVIVAVLVIRQRKRKNGSTEGFAMDNPLYGVANSEYKNESDS